MALPKRLEPTQNTAEAEAVGEIMAELVEEQGEAQYSGEVAVLEGLVLVLVPRLTVVPGVVIQQVQAVMAQALAMSLVVVTAGVDRF